MKRGIRGKYIESPGQYLLLRTDILQKSFVGCRWYLSSMPFYSKGNGLSDHRSHGRITVFYPASKKAKRVTCSYVLYCDQDVREVRRTKYFFVC